MNKHYAFLLLALLIIISSCVRKDACSSSLERLKDSRLDFIADTIANVKSKDYLTEKDMLYIKQLQDEENAMWLSSEAGCKK